jgi:hypothetical protein
MVWCTVLRTSQHTHHTSTLDSRTSLRRPSIPPFTPPSFRLHSPTLHSRPSLPPFTLPTLRPTLRHLSPCTPPLRCAALHRSFFPFAPYSTVSHTLTISVYLPAGSYVLRELLNRIAGGNTSVFAPHFAVCLFVLFSFYVLHPEANVDLLQKKPAAAPACDPQQKRSPAPSVRCAPFSGYGFPTLWSILRRILLPVEKPSPA